MLGIRAKCNWHAACTVLVALLTLTVLACCCLTASAWAADSLSLTSGDIAVQASKVVKPGNMDKYIGRGKNVMVVAKSNTLNSRSMPIYAGSSSKSKVVFWLQGRSCVTCITKGMKKGRNYEFMKVWLPNCTPSIGYVKTSQFTFDVIDKATFGLPSTKGLNARRIKACKFALSLLGARWSGANSTDKRRGLACNQLLNKCYRAAGYQYSTGGAAGYRSSRYGKTIKRTCCAREMSCSITVWEAARTIMLACTSGMAMLSSPQLTRGIIIHEVGLELRG